MRIPSIQDLHKACDGKTHFTILLAIALGTMGFGFSTYMKYSSGLEYYLGFLCACAGVQGWRSKAEDGLPEDSKQVN